MLKITAIDEEHQRTLVLEGKLVDPWVSELERSWSEAQHTLQSRKLVVDLRDVITISHHGENVLYLMMNEGATIRCRRGILARHVLQQLKRKWKIQCRKRKDEQ